MQQVVDMAEGMAEEEVGEEELEVEVGRMAVVAL